nr:MAG TPA: hypothetical protein [Caudoviricetes sp.]DAR77594.1 MAG TPA: hypothetical protein [Caudoviricetes sp.]DAX29154.1 MAG TPA: hypothetical protein [Caudoviricetes sp.]
MIHFCFKGWLLERGVCSAFASLCVLLRTMWRRYFCIVLKTLNYGNKKENS